MVFNFSRKKRCQNLTPKCGLNKHVHSFSISKIVLTKHLFTGHFDVKATRKTLQKRCLLMKLNTGITAFLKFHFLFCLFLVFVFFLLLLLLIAYLVLVCFYLFFGNMCVKRKSIMTSLSRLYSSLPGHTPAFTHKARTCARPSFPPAPLGWHEQRLPDHHGKVHDHWTSWLWF